MQLTVHMIGNAHIDPVWLWTWPRGVDEALATCRSACDMLDEYPPLHITRGDAWVYWWVQRTDPVLFERITRHVAEGRWHPVGGWWVQADCNLPTAESFRMQGQIGTQYFREQFGKNVTVGFCLDSFGHCATLPSFLRSAGLDSYVFLRPQQHEKELPVLFTWQAPDGKAVTAFRISHSYTARTLDDLKKNVAAAIEHMPENIGHTMCFYGVGDHGGGPTREQIEWIHEQQDYAPGIELRFSDPATFFSRIQDKQNSLPVIRDELQYHAIGCYSAVHKMKQTMRRSEILACQADHLLARTGNPQNSEARTELAAAWKYILFNQFHDILAGSSIEQGYEHAYEQLGFAASIARDIIVTETRRITAQLPPAKRQRLVLHNTSGIPFEGMVEFDPWLGYRAHERPVRLIDPDGADIPLQRIQPNAAVEGQMKLLFKAKIPPQAETIYAIARDQEITAENTFTTKKEVLKHESVKVTGSSTGISRITATDAGELLGSRGISVAVFEDKSDTWSHGIDRFDENLNGIFTAESPWQIIEKGPLRACMQNTLKHNTRSLATRVYLHEHEQAVRCRFRLDWSGRHTIVKLLILLAFTTDVRVDGIPGGQLQRECNGREYPIHNWIMLSGPQAALAVVSPDIYSGDVQADGMIRLTLLRSPVFAHHDPYRLNDLDRYHATGQHLHDYEITLLFGTEDISDRVTAEVERQKKPVWVSETTVGMK